MPPLWLCGRREREREREREIERERERQRDRETERERERERQRERERERERVRESSHCSQCFSRVDVPLSGGGLESNAAAVWLQWPVTGP